MARLMKGGDRPAYRAVITETRTYEDGREPFVHTSYVGPYGTAGVAKAAITREKRARERWNLHDWHKYTVAVTGYVERSQTQWERVDDE